MRSEKDETDHKGLPMVMPEAGDLHEGWLARIVEAYDRMAATKRERP